MHCVVESSISASVSECETSFVKRGAFEDEAFAEQEKVESAPVTLLDEAI